MRRWLRHAWRTRTVASPYGTLPCRCTWWKRSFYLVLGR